MERGNVKNSDGDSSKVYGFVLRFGYVESGYASHFIVHHTGGYFDSLKEALASLMHVVARDYLSGVKSQFDMWKRYESGKKKNKQPEPDDPTLEELQAHIDSLPLVQASEGVAFDEPNDETWWPWDSLAEQIPNMHMYWEYCNSWRINDVLPRFIDVDELAVEFPEFPDFMDELRQYQTVCPYSDDDIHAQWWRERGAPENCFRPVVGGGANGE